MKIKAILNDYFWKTSLLTISNVILIVESFFSIFVCIMMWYSFIEFAGDGEVIEQIISLQTNDNGERSPERSVLDGMIRQLQQQQDQRMGAGQEAVPSGLSNGEETPRRGKKYSRGMLP